MELRHLRYFVAVAEELNFRKAAERLRVAQPALSSQIQDLEADLGVKLLDRNTGGVRLTAGGAAFLAETRLTLAQAEKAATVARDAASGRRGRLTIGYIGSLTLALIPPAIKRFRELFPEVEVVMVDVPAYSDQVAALEAGELQLAFTSRPASVIPGGYERMLVLRSNGRVACGRIHRFARKSAVGLEELLGETVVCLGNRKGESAHGEIIKRIFSSVALKTPPLKNVDGSEALHAMLASGLAVSILAETVGLAQRKEIVLRKIRNPGVDATLEVTAYWREGPGSPLVHNFTELLRATRKVTESA